MGEQELIDTREQVTEMNGGNASLTNAKRKLENDIHQMQADLDNMLASCKNSEEKAKKAMVDAGRLADELRSEQDHAAAQDKAARTTEVSLAEMQNRPPLPSLVELLRSQPSLRIAPTTLRWS